MSVDTQKNITFLALPNEIQIIIIKYMGVQFINNNLINQTTYMNFKDFFNLKDNYIHVTSYE